MITAQSLQEAIAYYNGKLEPSPQDAIVLAACYILRDHMYPQEPQESQELQAYSLPAAPPETQYRYSGAGREAVGDYGDSDFLIAIRGKDPAEMWGIMDTAMKTMQVISRKTYDGIMDMILQ